MTDHVDNLRRHANPDRCTDPDNCRRCSEDKDTPHAGIPHAQPERANGRVADLRGALLELLDFVDNVPTDEQLDARLQSGMTGRRAYSNALAVLSASAAEQASPKAEEAERQGCGHSWHDYGRMNVVWCDKCNAKAVAGYEDRPFIAAQQEPTHE